MANYQFSEDAIKDLDEICDYIAQNNAIIRTYAETGFLYKKS